MSLLLKGIEYADSKQKRSIDLLFASALYIPARLAQLALIANVDFKDTRHFLQERMGANGEPFQVHKLRTLQDDGVTPINERAAKMRTNGLDELIQVKNILRGNMSAVGRRPLVPAEHFAMFDSCNDGKLVDRFRKISLPRKTGVTSKITVDAHMNTLNPTEEQSVIYMEGANKTILDGSPQYDALIILDTIAKALSNKMTVGAHRPFPEE